MSAEAAAIACTYMVSCLPLEHEDYAHFALTVQLKRNPRRWIISDGVQYFGADGQRAYPSTLSDNGKISAPFAFPTAEEAIEVAKRWAPKLTVNGRTVDDVSGGAS